jgi:hypothetical protein
VFMSRALPSALTPIKVDPVTPGPTDAAEQHAVICNSDARARLL